ncbi:MAG: hypothetical protein V1824_03915 [archaeon]
MNNSNFDSRKLKQYIKAKTKMQAKAQAPLEMIVILGVLVIGAVIFGTLYMGKISDNKSQDKLTEGVNSTVDQYSDYFNSTDSNIPQGGGSTPADPELTEISIVNPPSGNNYLGSLNFDADYEDNEIDLNSCKWYLDNSITSFIDDSDCSGSVNTDSWGLGLHNIKVVATYEGHTEEDDRNINLVTPPEFTSISIITPAQENIHFTKGAVISFDANHIDSSLPLADCNWYLDNINGTAFSSNSNCATQYTSAFWSVGQHTIYVKGKYGTTIKDDNISINIDAVNLTSVNITSPTNNSNFTTDSPISFTANLASSEGTFGNVDCNWYKGSSGTTFLKSTTDDSNCNFSGNGGLLGAGSHIIKLKAKTHEGSNWITSNDINITVNYTQTLTSISLDSPTITNPKRFSQAVDFNATYINGILPISCDWNITKTGLAKSFTVNSTASPCYTSKSPKDLNLTVTSPYTDYSVYVKGTYLGNTVTVLTPAILRIYPDVNLTFTSPANDTNYYIGDSITFTGSYSQSQTITDVNCHWSINGLYSIDVNGSSGSCNISQSFTIPSSATIKDYNVIYYITYKDPIYGDGILKTLYPTEGMHTIHVINKPALTVSIISPITGPIIRPAEITFTGAYQNATPPLYCYWEYRYTPLMGGGEINEKFDENYKGNNPCTPIQGQPNACSGNCNSFRLTDSYFNKASQYKFRFWVKDTIYQKYSNLVTVNFTNK